MRYEAQGIVSVELRDVDGKTLPEYAPGAHIDLHLGNGLVRSYSLCGAPEVRDRYVVGVLLDRNSRGGSRYVHEQLRVGSTLKIGGPRNNFVLDEAAPRTVLVAGGGFKGGQVLGSSDAKGEEVKDRPVYPVDLLGSIYHLAGINTKAKLPHPMGLDAYVLPDAAENVKSAGLLTEIM
jgi:hypothetical protein